MSYQRPEGQPLVGDRAGYGTSVQAGDVKAVRSAYRGEHPVETLTEFSRHGAHPAVRKFVLFFGCWQILMIILFASFGKYNDLASGNGDVAAAQAYVTKWYPFFQDVNVMIFIGFGFLMTFLKKYGYSAVGINFLLAALVIQWYALNNTFWSNLFTGQWQQVELSIEKLMTADFCAGAVLISYGGLLGKLSPVQMMFLAIVEVVLYSINEQIGLMLQVADIGGSMTIHMFGAYFGLAAAWVMSPPSSFDNPNNGAVYHSDLFSMIGTVFLWMFWPSFNGGTGVGPQQHRAVLNTVYSLSASCVAAFVCSAWLRPEKKFNMVDIQNATLAGGVAVGTSADMLIGGGGALTIGTIAGVVSVAGFSTLSPWLEEHFKLHDTCGIHNLHGMPSVLGAVSGVIASFLANPAVYGASLGLTFPARVAAGRTASSQAVYQVFYIASTMIIGIMGGLIFGALLNKPSLQGPGNTFLDSDFWEVPETESPYYFDHRGEHGSKEV